MTEAARQVLQDAELALNNLSGDAQNEVFRIQWFGVIGLLRAVGHVLANVDANSTPSMKQAIDRKWKELQNGKPHPDIFWSFIHGERNRFLKEYRCAFSRSLISRYSNGESVTLLHDIAAGNGSLTGNGLEVSFIYRDGPFKDLKPDHVALQAITWWKSYLDEVDLLAKQP